MSCCVIRDHSPFRWRLQVVIFTCNIQACSTAVIMKKMPSSHCWSVYRRKMPAKRPQEISSTEIQQRVKKGKQIIYCKNICQLFRSDLENHLLYSKKQIYTKYNTCLNNNIQTLMKQLYMQFWRLTWPWAAVHLSHY